MNFTVIQVGICLYLPQSEGGYTACPFNFYVMRDTTLRNSNNILLESGAINFHKLHQMDFNKWIYHGISYIKKQVADEILQKLQVKQTFEE